MAFQFGNGPAPSFQGPGTIGAWQNLEHRMTSDGRPVSQFMPDAARNQFCLLITNRFSRTVADGDHPFFHYVMPIEKIAGDGLYVRGRVKNIRAITYSLRPIGVPGRSSTTSEYEFMVPVQRYGHMVPTNDDAMETPEGRANFAEKLTQSIQGAYNTLIMVAATELMNFGSSDAMSMVVDMVQGAFAPKAKALQNTLRVKLTGCINRDSSAIQMMSSFANDVFKFYDDSTASVIIMSTNAASVAGLRPRLEGAAGVAVPPSGDAKVLTSKRAIHLANGMVVVTVPPLPIPNSKKTFEPFTSEVIAKSYAVILSANGYTSTLMTNARSNNMTRFSLATVIKADPLLRVGSKVPGVVGPLEQTVLDQIESGNGYRIQQTVEGKSVITCRGDSFTLETTLTGTLAPTGWNWETLGETFTRPTTLNELWNEFSATPSPYLKIIANMAAPDLPQLGFTGSHLASYPGFNLVRWVSQRVAAPTDELKRVVVYIIMNAVDLAYDGIGACNVLCLPGMTPRLLDMLIPPSIDDSNGVLEKLKQIACTSVQDQFLLMVSDGIPLPGNYMLFRCVWAGHSEKVFVASGVCGTIVLRMSNTEYDHSGAASMHQRHVYLYTGAKVVRPHAVVSMDHALTRPGELSGEPRLIEVRDVKELEEKFSVSKIREGSAPTVIPMFVPEEVDGNVDVWVTGKEDADRIFGDKYGPSIEPYYRLYNLGDVYDNLRREGFEDVTEFRGAVPESFKNPSPPTLTGKAVLPEVSVLGHHPYGTYTGARDSVLANAGIIGENGGEAYKQVMRVQPVSV